MRTSLLLVFIVLGFQQNTFGQRVSKQEYYNFFNSILNQDSLEEFNLSSKPEFKYVIEATSDLFKDSAFSSLDAKFIKNQLRSARRLKWTSGKISGSKIIQSRKLNRIFKSGPSGWEKYYKKHKEGFTTYSIPLFSVDKTKCIVYQGLYCGGLCGRGCVYLFVKNGTNWEIKSYYSCWVS